VLVNRDGARLTAPRVTVGAKKVWLLE
jgi:hypothetical protein